MFFVYIYAFNFLYYYLFCVYHHLIFYYCLLYYYYYVMLLIDEYFYTQEIWDNWAWDLDLEFWWKLVAWRITYLYWECCVSGLTDVYWGDWFFPEDNWLYPEFRFFHIYTDETPLYWA